MVRINAAAWKRRETLGKIRSAQLQHSHSCEKDLGNIFESRGIPKA
jgi:hypothetical protein